jgi:hypothetical protein
VELRGTRGSDHVVCHGLLHTTIVLFCICDSVPCVMLRADKTLMDERRMFFSPAFSLYDCRAEVTEPFGDAITYRRMPLNTVMSRGGKVSGSNFGPRVHVQRIHSYRIPRHKVGMPIRCPPIRMRCPPIPLHAGIDAHLVAAVAWHGK